MTISIKITTTTKQLWRLPRAEIICSLKKIFAIEQQKSGYRECAKKGGVGFGREFYWLGHPVENDCPVDKRMINNVINNNTTTKEPAKMDMLFSFQSLWLPLAL